MLLAVADVAAPLQTKFIQVHPTPRDPLVMVRTQGQTRAVLLIHGFKVHGPASKTVAEPIFHSWQQPGSTLVTTLGKDSDVFAFSYGQNVKLDAVSQSPALATAVRKLKGLGYSDIVLMGHSAGGIIARHLVEDQPNLGVTKVIQVCSPNGGAGMAALSVCREQEPFARSLSKEERKKCVNARAGIAIPPHIDFVCVVAALTNLGDGLVSCREQWTEDLQRQGIPALRLSSSHWTIVRSESNAQKLAELIRRPPARLSPEQVQALKKTVLK
jgi:hypothetical protein